MLKTAENSNPVWKQLLISDNLAFDLDSIYSDAVLEKLSILLEKCDASSKLVPGVHKTARSFLRGKYEKQLQKSAVLQSSGRHLATLGVVAGQLSSTLKMATKSDLVQKILADKLGERLTADRPFGEVANTAARFHSGPAVPLSYLQDVSAALAEAVGELVDMPEYSGNQAALRAAGDKFVTESSGEPHPDYKDLPKNHALEAAAWAFRETWEAFSDQPYIRGRYKPERGKYDSRPAYGLFLIVSELDRTVTESLCGTAIENIRRRS